MGIKVLLINASGNWLKKEEHDIEQLTPPIGPMYLSSYLKKTFGSKVETRILDYIVDIRHEQRLVEYIQEFEPDLIGIRGITMFQKLFQDVAKLSKQYNKAIVVGGGPYISSDENMGLQDSDCDITIYGEGELTLAEIVERMINGQELEGIEGTAIRKDGQIIKYKHRELIEDLNTLPFPDYSNIDNSKYTSYLSYGYNKRLQGVIFTSRGCAYNCAFCHNIFGKRFRARDPMNVIEEIEILFRQGVRDFYIVDDNFNFNPKRSEEIFNLLISKNYNKKIKLYFPNGLNSNCITTDFIDLMCAAGTIWTGFAIETVSEKLQKVINKPVDLNKISNAIHYSYRKGLVVNYWGMLGIPGETLEDANALIDFMLDLPPSIIPMLFQLKAFPGTKFHELSEKKQDTATDTSYHNFVDVIRKDIRYIDILKRWEEHVLSEERLNAVTRRLFEHGYTYDDVESSYRMLYRNMSESDIRGYYKEAENGSY